ncbi:tripartite tricarboxylate transporter TctB family protein [Aquibium sp. A9E412]|uniref:tripartite tricarboxylate transporter TctB family protein n=1 Tax=Aquibium sp. A9E412 TaxID=2976767 RepID=UPI0025B1F68E|nr:tripartite tricarboxylate transporter TctB family protein [Aquibium sp. A9E412]MDN2567910.1 tripartite tricarboxylate transporter TctB family protein [Aquibium sp. A9E412]
MKVSDVILGPIVVAIGIVTLVAASMQPKPFFGSGYGGGFFPSIIGIGLFGLGAMLTLAGWSKRNEAPLLVFGDWIRSGRHIANAAAVIGALLFYILTSDALGFVISGFVSLFVVLVQFSRAPLISLVIAIVTILLVKTVFQDILLVPLPWGILEPYSGSLTWR